MLVKGT